jgi:biotin carboxyl carrier protein
MPGLIVHVQARAGQHVQVGEPVVIMEAMKMRNELTAEVAGVVKQVAVAVGDKVDSQAALVTIERE